MNQNFQTLLQQAIEDFQNKNFMRATSILKKIVKVDSCNLPALHILGLINASQKNYKEATYFLKKALKINPEDASIHYNLAKVLIDSGYYVESIPHHRKVIALAPNNSEALLNYGKTLSHLDQHEEALICFDKAISFNPNYAEALLNKGLTLQALKRYDEAIVWLDKSLFIKPNLAEAWFSKGSVLASLKRHNEAVVHYDKALILIPNYQEALFSKAVALHDLKQFDEAIQNFDKVLALKSDSFLAWAHKGVSLQFLKRFEEAISNYDVSLKLKPDYEEVLLNKGVCLQSLKRFDEALIHYDKSLKIKPDHYEVMLNKGCILHAFKNLDQALICFDKALSIKPDFHDAIYNKGILLLLQGNLTSGFSLYESRWQSNSVSDIIGGNRFFESPIWRRGEDLKNKSILLFSEQGLGDFIQFYRYTKLLTNLGAEVILETPAPLENLVKNLNGAVKIVIRGEKLPRTDYHYPLMSLPLAFNTDLTNIPFAEGYLFSQKNKVNDWIKRLGDKTKPRIGIVWSGSKHHENDSNRSINLSELFTYLPEKNQYICLQKEFRDGDIEILNKQPNITNFSHLLNDFDDTAALIETLDLVVSVDTSVAHLSAALGKQTWLLLPFVPDWRWLLESNDSPWYRSITLYRQNKLGEWGSVLKHLNSDLLKF